MEIKPEQKQVKLERGDVFEYEKLILALGSKPQLAPIPDIEKKGIWSVKKDYEYLKKFREAVLNSKNIVIIGGGFIGVELAEELSNVEGLDITIVEMLLHCLITNFDQEFTLLVEEKLKNKGIKLFTNREVKGIGGGKKAEYVELDSGEKLTAGLVVLSIGAQPNVELAQKADIKAEEKGGITVDEYLRTNIPDIFAVGDCTQAKDFITGKNIPVMLSSVATGEARIAANNLYQIELLKESKGTVGAFSTFVDGLALGVTGLTEKKEKQQGFDYLVGEAEAFNHHP